MFGQWLSRCSAGLRSLHSQNFRLFTIGNCISLIGRWMQRVGVGWLAWTLTHSSFWLGLIAFADLFPIIFLSPLSGILADRYDRRRIMLFTQHAALIQALLLAALTSTGLINIEGLLVLTLGLGVADAINQPARLSWLPSLVKAVDLPSAVAVNSIVFNIARFIGPAIAGIVIAGSGVVITFVLNALSYAVFIATLLCIRLKSKPHGHKRSNIWHEMRAGYRYTARHPQIGPVFLMLILTALGIRGIPELTPALAEMAFQRGAGGFAVLITMIGLGALVAGLWIIGRDLSKDLASLIVRHVLCLSLSVLYLAINHEFFIALSLFFVIGFSLAVTGISAQTMVQMKVAEHMRGRVFALYGVVYRGGSAIGALWMGTVASCYGVRWTIYAGAALCFAAWCWAKCSIGPRHEAE